MKYDEENYIVNQDFDVKSLNYDKIKNQIAGIELFAKASKKCFFIFDYYKHNYFYFKSYNEFFSEIPEKIDAPYLFFNEKLHPDDIDFVYNIHHKTFKYIFSLDIEARKDLILYYRTRMKNSNNEFVTTNITLKLIEKDSKGYIWMVLFIIDSADFENYMIPYIENINGEKEEFDLNQKLFNKLTNKEKEIVLISFQDYTQKEISEKNCISLNTLKKHFNNIYLKLGVDNKMDMQKKLLFVPD